MTTFIRTCTNYDASFLISQDPRWNYALPSLALGDTQPDGMQLVSLEGSAANGPRLLIVRLPDPPLLAIQLSGGNVNLLWPTNGPGFTLEATTTVSPTAWAVVTNSVGTSGTNYSVTVNVSNTSRYFRLRR